MEPFLFAILVGVIVFIVFSKFTTGTSASVHNKNALEQIMDEATQNANRRSAADEELDILKADVDESVTLKTLSYLPFGKGVILKLVKAGRQETAGLFVTLIVTIILVSLFCVKHFDLNAKLYIAAVIVPLWLGNKILKSQIESRKIEFINMFPDVLDMIVRSVKSGFPINNAIAMVADNMDDPVKKEFQQLSDELALGSPLQDALDRLATRIDEQDLHFFVVVLKIQQETGGNLAEVITNLSGVIRKRKQLRLKIRAMTSEGRITGYILAAIPILLFGILFYMTPHHLDPLFDTELGNIFLYVVIGLIVGSQVIVRKMIDIDI